ncbi:MAG: class I SAM-dependent methyltransferase [Deltaproteobacteria bacterium]|nr:MAG: class I SAM-dependent methyltransferase [Deltaproteobacteria bacterium]
MDDGMEEIVYSDKKLIETLHGLVQDLSVKGRWLDMPSGGGALARRLKKLSLKVIEGELHPAGDLSDRIIVRLDMNAPALPFADQSFDGIACVEGIEHIENFFALIRELRRILKPSGVLFLTTPNMNKLGSRWHTFWTGFPHYLIRPNPESPEERDPFPHIHMLPFHELRYALYTQGMRIRAIHTNRIRFNDALFFPFWPLVALSTWRRLRKERKPNQRLRNREIFHQCLSWKVLFGNILILVLERDDG